MFPFIPHARKWNHLSAKTRGRWRQASNKMQWVVLSSDPISQSEMLARCSYINAVLKSPTVMVEIYPVKQRKLFHEQGMEASGSTFRFRRFSNAKVTLTFWRVYRNDSPILMLRSTDSCPPMALCCKCDVRHTKVVRRGKVPARRPLSKSTMPEAYQW